LLTLTGIGGVGKTRLATAIAADPEPHFRDGVVWVELAPLTHDTFVAPAVAQAIGIENEGGLPLMEAITSSLRDSDRLLVLDNCERLAGAAAELAAALLSACPDITILATSRVRLALSAEVIYPVAPLALALAAAAPSNGAMSDSATLFVQRARHARPDLTLDAGTEQDVDEICRRLEGLPLAIELAAARVRALSISSLRSLLGDRLRFLIGGTEDGPERHRTLTAALAWSYDLLDAQAQAAFCRLAVCAGGCSFEAASAVMGTPDVFDTLGNLETLFDQSLIRTVPDAGGELRYTMLETVREFAFVRLDERGDESATRDRHAEFFLALAETAESEVAGPDQGAWLRRLDADRDNVRGALAWFEASNQPSEMLRLGSALWPYWSRRGSILEGRDWLQRAVALGEAEPAVQARAFQRLGNLAIDLGDYSAAREMYSASLDISRSTSNQRAIADALNGLGIVASDTGDLDTARLLHEEAWVIRNDLGDAAGCARITYILGLGALAKGDSEGAARHLGRAIGIHRDLGDAVGVAYDQIALAQVDRHVGRFVDARDRLQQSHSVLADLGDELGLGEALTEQGVLAYLEGDPVRSVSLLDEAIDIRVRLGDRVGVVLALERVAGPVLDLDQPNLAATILGLTCAEREALGTPASPADLDFRHRTEVECMKRMSREELESAMNLGRSMSVKNALSRVSELSGSHVNLDSSVIDAVG
jgi:predicted ATPase